MKNEQFYDNYLDNLFQSARNQEPAYSFSETQTTFVAGSAVGLSSFATAKLLGSSIFKYKFLIMTITAIALLSSIFLMYNSSWTTDNNSMNDVFKNEIGQEVVKENKSQLTVTTSFSVFAKDSKRTNKSHSTVGVLIAKPITLVSSNTFINKYFDNKFPFLAQNNNDEDTILVTHRITEKTTNEELMAIQEQAQDAGIEMKYKTTVRRKVIRRLTITLEKEKMFYSIRTAPISKEFAVDLSWRTDGEGKVIDFQQVYPEGAYVKVRNQSEKKVQKHIKKLKDMESDSFETLNTDAVDPKLQVINKELALRDKIPSDIMLNRKVIQNYVTVSHVLNVSTTETELDKIQKEALAANMVFKYTVSYKKEEIKNIVIEMIIRTDDGNLRNDVRIYRKKGESFSVPIIWRVDETGKAVDFGNPNQMKYLGM